MRLSRVLRRWLALCALATIVGSPALPALGQQAAVLVARVEGPITPPLADFLTDAVARAEREGHTALLVEIDTPGGLDAAMRRIIQSFLMADVPVIAYVYPPGGRAASAGALIAMAAHVAAMAPGTNIGAATPVPMEGGQIEDKVIEDAAAYAEELATIRGRNVEFAIEAVREGRSEPAGRAAELGVVDLLAGSRAELVAGIDGETVTLHDDREVTLELAGAGFVDHEMGLFQSLRQRLADPNLAFLFLSIGTLAIIYELANPGMGIGGIIGIILILLAMFALAVLPVNLVGVLLLLLAAGLFIAELFVPGVGVFAGGGAISLILAGIFLFRGDFGVDLSIIFPTVFVVLVGVVVAGRLVWRARRRPTQTGAGAHVGRSAVARSVEGSRGQVLIDGTWWKVRRDEGSLSEGEQVRVVGSEELELIVEPEGE